MKLETKVMIDAITISTTNSDFHDVKNQDEFNDYAPQKGRALEDILKLVFEQKITPQNLKRDSITITYTAGGKYFVSYKVSMGMVALQAEEI